MHSFIVYCGTDLQLTVAYTHTQFEDSHADSQAHEHVTCTPVNTDCRHTRRSSERQTNTPTTLACRSVVPLDAVGGGLTSLQQSNVNSFSFKVGHSSLAAAEEKRIITSSTGSRGGKREESISGIFRRCQMICYVTGYATGAGMFSPCLLQFPLNSPKPLKPVDAESCPQVWMSIYFGPAVD